MTQFISGFNYYGYKYYKSMSFEGAVNKYLDELEGFSEKHTDCKLRACHKFVNGQANDLGFKFEEYLLMGGIVRRKEFVRDYINKLEDELDLVLITEEFTLSMVLIAHKYCMAYEDIYFMKSNESKRKVQVCEKTKERIKLLLSIDYQIYEHFRDLFYEAVKKEGVTDDDVAQFIEENDEKSKSCTDGKQV